MVRAVAIRGMQFDEWHGRIDGKLIRRGLTTAPSTM